MTAFRPTDLGYYCYDVIYFSASYAVEQEFERRILATSINVELMGNVDYYLSQSFNYRKQQNRVLRSSHCCQV